MKRKAKKENPLTAFRKLNEARMGRVIASYPDPPNKEKFDKFQKTAETPLYDFEFTVPVGKAAAYTDIYMSTPTWEQKRAQEKIDNKRGRQAARSSKKHRNKVDKQKAKGRRNNPALKPAKAGPQTTEKFMCTGVGCHQ